ncbi:hypothetical protein NIES2135_44690 [Leptolyngbya boryana NIES-2135]|uniref:Uncharacterized protein n=1 Tax=Leptolyngbya boryana NIES-2135 TaxID=1973484 RepID=A0A1Z4JLG3_LEPBY|nr:hypothetical protein NIES2135_44690 [Leptolyngbya boryana NIES-2135]
MIQAIGINQGCRELLEYYSYLRIMGILMKVKIDCTFFRTHAEDSLFSTILIC